MEEAQNTIIHECIGVIETYAVNMPLIEVYECLLCLTAHIVCNQATQKSQVDEFLNNMDEYLRKVWVHSQKDG